jgi:hypothetical protein
MPKDLDAVIFTQLDPLGGASQHGEQVQDTVGLQTVLPVENDDLGCQEHRRYQSRVVCGHQTFG